MIAVGRDPFVRNEVPVSMRDGIVLPTDVYAPAAHGRWPALIRRTPYDKTLWAPVARELAARGYVVVLQDVRGRHSSTGDFQLTRPGEHPDRQDGHDTIAWAASHELCDGSVGMWGHSYDAWTGWRAAADAPPSLGGVVAASMGMRSLDVSRGIFDIGRRLHWYYVMAVDSRRRSGRGDGPLVEAEADRSWVELERWKWLWYLPLDAIPERVFAGLSDDLRQHMRHVSREQWALDELHPRVTAPVFVITGWWDRMVTSIDNFSGVMANGPTALRPSHRLLVGPWGHQPPTWERSVRGSVDFGAASTRKLVDVVAGWFDRRLKGAGGTADPPVELFVVNAGWRSEPEWPPPGMRETELYLRGHGHANGVRGDGALAWTSPSEEDTDRYEYDPRDPVMSLMEPNSHWAPYDQRPNDHRIDKLVYRSEPLERPVEMIGTPRFVLWAASDAPDTDWVVRLVDEPPGGPVIAVSQGILRARYRAGYEREALLTPREVERFVIPMTPMGAVFPEGHRIRIDVTSSDFPNYDRNHNTGRDFWIDPDLRVARQTVFHDRSRPSHLVAPVVR